MDLLCVNLFSLHSLLTHNEWNALGCNALSKHSFSEDKPITVQPSIASKAAVTFPIYIIYQVFSTVIKLKVCEGYSCLNELGHSNLGLLCNQMAALLIYLS